MAIVPAPVVPAPAPLGLRYGLLTAAIGPLSLSSVQGGLGGGVRYLPETCGRTRTYPVDCPADVDPPTKTFDPNDDLIDADPFVVYASLQCGASGFTAAELEAKVRRRYANGEQSGVESEFGDILAAAADPLTAPDPSSIESVVGELEQWLYGSGANYGNIGYLHAPIRVMAHAAFAGMLVQDRNLWKTQMGTIWVFGGGYPDDGTIYITGQVTLWRADDIVVPPVDQTFDRATNQYKLVAEREYAAAYDCAAASAVFDPAVPAS